MRIESLPFSTGLNFIYNLNMNEIAPILWNTQHDIDRTRMYPNIILNQISLYVSMWNRIPISSNTKVEARQTFLFVNQVGKYCQNNYMEHD